MLLPALLVLSLAAAPDLSPEPARNERTSLMVTGGATYRGFGVDPSVSIMLEQEITWKEVFFLFDVSRNFIGIGDSSLERTAFHIGLGSPVLRAGIFTLVIAGLLGASIQAQSIEGVTTPAHPSADIGVGAFGEFALSRHWALVVKVAPRAVLPAYSQQLDGSHAFRESIFQLHTEAGARVTF